MKRIILFRYHNRFDACFKQLQLIKLLNPTTPIYGLYGGDESEFEFASLQLNPFFEYNYCIREKEPFWKWINSDLVYRLWYKDYGYQIDFDQLVVLEWDLVLLDSVEKLYGHIPVDTLGLTGLIPLKKIERKWFWSSDPVQRANWLRLLDYVKRNFNYSNAPYACIGGGVLIPKTFLEKYAAIDVPEIGNDELRLPLMAEALGFKMMNTGFFRRWFSRFEQCYFNADNMEVKIKTINKQLKKKHGRRAFHPVRIDNSFQEILKLIPG